MNVPIMIIELKGFAAMAEPLARDMDVLGITSERVRGAGIHMMNQILAEVRRDFSCSQVVHIGGDTWFLAFEELETAIAFGSAFLRIVASLTREKGVYFLKPSVAVGIGQPRLQGDRFLDDTSIATYRIADSGKPFTFYLIGEAIANGKRLSWVSYKQPPLDHQGPPISLIDWLVTANPKSKQPTAPALSLPTLLLDSEVIYSQSAREAVDNILRQQARSRAVFAFGGPVPLEIPYYRDYLRATLALLREEQGPVFTILSYIPANEPDSSFAWLELCRRLVLQFPSRLSFAAFAIPEGQLRPFSYQVFDDNTVHVGLRSYSPQKGTPTMSGAIMFRNSKIAGRFKDEFLENWRRIGPLNEGGLAAIITGVTGLSAAAKKLAVQQVELLLSEVGAGAKLKTAANMALKETRRKRRAP